MPYDEPSNRQSIKTGLRSNLTTPALIPVGCGRACNLLQTKKGSTAESYPVTQANYYARIEANNTETCMRAPSVLEDCVITLSAADVIKTSKQVNIHKAAGPDGLLGRVL